MIRKAMRIEETVKKQESKSIKAGNEERLKGVMTVSLGIVKLWWQAVDKEIGVDLISEEPMMKESDEKNEAVMNEQTK